MKRATYILYYTIILSLICNNFSFAQQEPTQKANIEKTIKTVLTHINFNHWQNNDDSTSFENSYLLNYLNKACISDPKTLEYNYDSLQGMNIITSSDKKVRIYNWCIACTSGAPSYNVLVQYKTGKKTSTFILNDVSRMPDDEVSTGAYYDTIYTIKPRHSGPVYLLVSYSQAAAGLYGGEICAYTIKKDSFERTSIFKTLKDTLSCIDYNYEASLKTQKTEPSIKLSKNLQKCYIPLISEDDSFSKKYLVYTFNGDKFVYTGTR